jgi:hypothetical protein
LLRKFDAEPPEEWVEAIDDISDMQLARGMRRIVFGWKGGVPNLPDFVRLCRAIGDDAPDDGRPRTVALPAPDTRKFDGWDISGNVRFHKYITHRLTENFRPWGAAWTEEHAECTRIAVRYKNAWAQDMREHTDADGVITQPSEEYQASAFADCMRRAEADIELYRKGIAA